MRDTVSTILAAWKRYILNKQYKEFVEESAMIAQLFYRGKDQDWINALQNLNDFLEGLNDRQIMPNVKKYLMDFIDLEIKTVKGEITKKKLTKERRNTVELISKAHAS